MLNVILAFLRGSLLHIRERFQFGSHCSRLYRTRLSIAARMLVLSSGRSPIFSKNRFFTRFDGTENGMALEIFARRALRQLQTGAHLITEFTRASRQGNFDVH